MNEIYIVDGQEYSVGQSRLKEFLQKFPNAVKKGKEQGSTEGPTMSQKSMGSQSDDGSSESVSWFDQTWFGRGVKAASTTGEATNLMSQNFSNISEESIQEFIKAKEQESKGYVESERMKKFQKQYVKEGKTWSAFFRGVKDQPGLLPELFVQSLGTQVGTLIDSPTAALGAAATGAAGGAAVGAVPGAIAGAMGGLATSMEAALTFGELIETRLKEKNQEFTDENIKALLESEGREIRNKALGRGLAIGTIEGFTGGLAGKAAVATKGVVKGAKKAALAASATGVGVEAAGGALGEITGRAVAGQEMDAAEIGFEAITGTTTAPVNVLAALKSAKQPTYRLNGEKVTYEQMKDFVDTADDIDIAKAEIKMENDFTGVGKKAKAKQEAAEKMIELSGDVATQEEVKTARQQNRISETIAFAETAGKKIGKDVKVVDNDIEAQKFYDKLVEQGLAEQKDVKGADGFIIGDSIIINKDIAGKTGQINVGAHEILHGILAKHLKSLVKVDAKGKVTDDSELRTFISDFKNTISKESRDYIENIINQRNKAGENLDLDTTDEWLTIYSDGITKNEISFNEGVFTKFKNFLQNVFRKFGYNKEFGSGLDTYNFMRDYQKSVKEGALSQRAVDVAGGGVAVTDTKKSVSPLDAIKALVPKSIKTQEDYYALLNDPRISKNLGIERIMDAKGNLAPVIEAYIRSRSTSSDMARENIKEVKKRLVNYDPAATREDGSIVGPEEGFGEFIFANARFGKLVAAKELAIKAEKEKRTTRVDDPDFKDIPDDTPTPTTKTKGVKTKLKQTKARQLTSLADLDVESSPLIKETTKIQLKKLIKSDPKNLVEKIQEVLIPDLVEIIRKEMGVIGQVKGELNIPDTYLAYLSDTYQKTISSMEIQKIRSNYKNLFKKEKMGFADYKTKKSDKPSLKKDSNYRKEIFRNVTTKAEFIKYHTEGKKNKLIANQRNLAIMRAEAEAVRAAEDYIIENSENLNEVYAAELRNFIDSKTIEKQKLEDKSFDSVKFSNTLTIESLQQVGDLVNLTEKNTITDVWNLETQQPIKGKYAPEIVQIVWNQVLKGNIYSDKSKALVDIIRKVPKNLIKGNLGTALETFKINVGIQAAKKHEGLTMLGEWVQEGGIPDFFADVFGYALYAEAKFGTSRGGKTTTNETNWKTGKFKINKRLEGNIDLVEKSVKRALKKSDKLVKDLKKLGFDIVDQDTVVDLKTHEKLGAKKAVVSDASVIVDADFIGRIYANKEYPVYLIDIDGAGLYYMPGDPFIEALAKELGIPKLEGKFPLITRILPQKKETKGVKVGYKYKLTTEPLIDPSNLKVKSNFSLSDIKTFDAIMNSETVAKLKIEQENKNKTKLSKSINFSRTVNDPKGITVLDFDDTLATTKSLVKYTTPEGETGTLNAEQFANSYEGLLDKGYVFDFSDFNKVVKGKVAPLFQKALKLQGKFGPENMFVLTARPPAAQKAIFDFLKANGLNIPLKNITGLGNSTSEAKALWIADKVGEGYNDFYFADDALQNVQAVKNMLDQFDVKSKVQQAKVKFSKSMDSDFNSILENVTGIDAEKRFSSVKARKRGESKGKFRFFIPPSHEDFVGLLYNFIGKGKEGNKHRDFFEQALIRPLNRAFRELNTARQSIANDYKNLGKRFPKAAKALLKKIPDSDFTYQDAVRVYLWDKHGYDIPGLSPTDQQNLVNRVNSMPNLKTYAENLNVISKREDYVKPSEGWEITDIRMDLDDATGRIGRAEFFVEFLENAGIIFSPENLNKIEAAYGSDMVSAIKDMLYRIETGRNRPSGQNKIVNGFMNWFNASVASTMFINVRSVVLQQMSLVNFINYSDNNILAVAKAFANQKQYWTDWAFLFNSDFMKQRRGGIKTDVNGAELVDSLKGAKNSPITLLNKLLQLGFKPTQIGDNIAIATGGAAYYRNRINTYLKQGLSQKEAEAKAFVDFQVLAEATQQSARPDMVSQQQASPLGKIILAFQNVTSQFNRLGKKAFLDIKNRRISPEYKNASNPQLQSDISNLSRIAYYFAIQNLVFATLQSALFMAMFDDDEEDKQLLRKKERIINQSIDSVLRGTGVWGAAIATLKNMAIKRFENQGKDWRANEYSVLAEALQVSPPLGARARKLVKAERELIWDKDIIKDMETFDIENPLWPAVTNYIEGTTNAPLNRTYNLTLQAKDGLNNQFSAYQRALRLGGWGRWDVGIEDVTKEKKKQGFSNKKKTKNRTRSRSENRSRTRTR